MLRLLLVRHYKDSLSELESALKKEEDIELLMAESGEKALNMIRENTVDLVVADEKLNDMAGLDLASRLISLNPMVNCAVTSSLTSEEFHAASEGLGLMDQLPVQPGKEDAEKLILSLRYIKGAYGGD
jgi:DNA-binding NtrC family response regulator